MEERKNQGIDIRTLRILFFAIVSFVIIFTFGFLGFYSQNSEIISSLYYTIQLIVIQVPGELHLYPWSVQIAAFTLPIYPAATLLGLLASAIGLQWNLVRLQFQPRDHVFLGTGRLTASLIHTLNTNKNKQLILAVDKNTEQKHARRVSQFSNTMLLNHDINDSFALQKLRLQLAKCVYIFAGKDDENIEIARKIITLLVRYYHNKKLPRLVINIESSDLLLLVTEENIFQEYQQQGGILWFSAPEQSARELIKKHPPRLNSSLNQINPLHIGVIGQNHQAEALVLQLVKQSASLSLDIINITVFGESREQFSRFITAHPVLTAAGDEPEFGQVVPLVSLKFIIIGSRGLSPRAIRNSISEQNNVALQVLYISESSDYKSLTSTLVANQAINSLSLTTRVITRLTGSHYNQCADAQAAMKSKHQSLTNVAWFHGVLDVFDSTESYPGETADTFGMLVHAAYSAIYHGEPLQDSSQDLQEKFEAKFDDVLVYAKNEWQSTLREDFRASSRQCGDHIFVKLRELGFRLERCTEGGGLAEKDIVKVTEAINDHFKELLMMEHRRFVTERLIDGWLAHKTNDKSHKLNWTIIPYEQLPESEKFKDEIIIRLIPVLLRHQIVREHYKLSEL